jgi:hypothetical protein
MCDAWINPVMGGINKLSDRAHCISFNNHIDEFIRSVPEDKLFVFPRTRAEQVTSAHLLSTQILAIGCFSLLIVSELVGCLIRRLDRAVSGC